MYIARLINTIISFLLFSESTHVYLTTPWTIKSLIGVCCLNNTDIMSVNHFRQGPIIFTLLTIAFTLPTTLHGILFSLVTRMSVARTLSLVVVSSAHVITLTDLLRINKFLREALAKADIDAAHRYLHERLSGWIGTMKGLAKLAYYPYKNPRFSCTRPYYTEKHKRTTRWLEQRCIEAGVVSLHIALLGEVEKQVLTKEGLVDYIVCLPWCLPQGSRAQQRACDLISYLSHEMQLQPPSLLNLAKAKLASMHFGLKKMLNTFSMQDLLVE